MQPIFHTCRTPVHLVQNKLPLDHLYHYDSMGTGVNV